MEQLKRDVERRRKSHRMSRLKIESFKKTSNTPIACSVLRGSGTRFYEIPR